MNKFLKEKGITILLLSVIFTFGTLFWTSDIINNQGDLSSVDLGWPIDFVSQNHSQLDPPERWFPNNIGFGLPQEYSTSIQFFPFAFDIVINFLIIFSILFTVFKFNPNRHFLRNIISVKYIMSAVGLAFLLFVSFLMFDNSKRISQMGVGVPPLEGILPTSLDRPPEDIVPIRVDGNELRDMIPPDLPDPNSEEMRLWRQNIWDERVQETLGDSVVQVKGQGTLDMPFMTGKEKEIITNIRVAYIDKWDSQNSFIFIEYNENNCDLFTCYGDSYQYDVVSKKYKQIFSNDEEWNISPDGKMAFSYEKDTTKETSETLGMFFVKDLLTGDVKTLGKAVRSIGFDGSYFDSYLSYFAWSPDSKSIAMYDWSDYNPDTGGPGVHVLSVATRDLSEREFLGHTLFREIGRPAYEQLLFWSPDSTKLYARDNYVVFDVVEKKEIFPPSKKNTIWFKEWLSDSKRILGVSREGFVIVYPCNGTKEGYVFAAGLFDAVSLRSSMIAPTPDGMFVLVAYKGGVYLIDLKTREFQLIDAMQPDDYSFLQWSPDGKKLLYKRDGKIIIREITWK